MRSTTQTLCAKANIGGTVRSFASFSQNTCCVFGWPSIQTSAQRSIRLSKHHFVMTFTEIGIMSAGSHSLALQPFLISGGRLCVPGWGAIVGPRCAPMIDHKLTTLTLTRGRETTTHPPLPQREKGEERERERQRPPPNQPEIEMGASFVLL